MSITANNLEAALLDQIVAGKMAGKDYAFVEVFAGDGWTLGIAVANQDGYTDAGKSFDSYDEAQAYADGMNAHIGLTPCTAFAIVASTMGGRTFSPQQQQRGTNVL